MVIFRGKSDIFNIQYFLERVGGHIRQNPLVKIFIRVLPKGANFGSRQNSHFDLDATTGTVFSYLFTVEKSP
jgi:hypothetical protein